MRATILRRSAALAASVLALSILGGLALDAHDHEAERLHYEAETNLLHEYLTQPPPEGR